MRGVDIRVADAVAERIGPGGIFGEMALIDQEHRSAQAVAHTDCQVVPVTRRRFEYLVQQVPGFALRVLEVMAHRLRRQNASVSGGVGG